MEKQPNSRMCFVCGVHNPIGLHLSFYADDQGRCMARFRPKPEHQGYPVTCTGESYQPCWTSQLKFQCTLTLCRYD